MIFKCIDNKNVDGRIFHITIGKIYNSHGSDLGSSSNWIDIINDIGQIGTYSKRRFVDISVIRHERLEELGI